MAMRRRKGSVPLFCAIAAAACFSLPQTDFTLLPEAGEFFESFVCVLGCTRPFRRRHPPSVAERIAVEEAISSDAAGPL